MKKFITALLFFSSCTVFQAQSAQDKKNAATLDSIFSVYTQKEMFNGSVLVAKNGKVLLKKGYGKANFTYDVPNKPDTKFKLASVSKQFTAMAIMMLQEKGKLNVNDPLSKFIADYPNGEKITIHHLLNHSSGIPSFTSRDDFDSLKVFPHTIEQIISYFKTQPLEFAPGEKFNYSNSGYILLTYIIEKASGESYTAFLQKNIFERLGMKNSGYCFTDAVIKDMAEGYSQINEGFQKAPYVDMSVPLGAGALYSTVEDLYLWDRALYTEQLVKKNTLEKIFYPSSADLGYGWFIDSLEGHKWVYHNGGIEGFITAINRFVDDDLCVIVLKNVDNQRYFSATKIACLHMLNEKYELPVERKVMKVDPAIYKKLTGTYELRPGFNFTIIENEGKLFVQATNQPQLQLFAEDEWKYFSKEVNATIEFVKGENGNAASLILNQHGRKMPAKRVQ